MTHTLIKDEVKSGAQAINVQNADSDSDDPFGLTSSKSRRATNAEGRSHRKQFAKEMRRAGSATIRDKEAYILIDGIRTETQVVKYEGTEEEKKLDREE